MLVAQCRDALTHTRTTDLKAYLPCHEGDMGCPVPSSSGGANADMASHSEQGKFATKPDLSQRQVAK